MKLLHKSEAGVSHYWQDDGQGGGVVTSAQDVAPILEANQALFNDGDGYSASREMRRIGSIPLILIAKWKAEEGWDAFDPACADKLRRKLLDPDFQKLLTAPVIGLESIEGGSGFR